MGHVGLLEPPRELRLIGLVETWIGATAEPLWSAQGMPHRAWTRLTVGATGSAAPLQGPGRLSGGLALFASPGLDLRLEDNDAVRGAYLWASIAAPAGLVAGVQANQRIYIALVYLHPHQQKFRPAWQAFEATLATYQDKGPVLVMGDLNAYTGKEVDYVPRPLEVGPLWQEDAAGHLPAPLAPPRRQSVDNSVSTQGRTILAACLASELLILNGRAPGDEDGKLTTRAHVVDYMIADTALWPAVRQLEHRWAPPLDSGRAISDHAALRLRLGALPGWTPPPPPMAVPVDEVDPARRPVALAPPDPTFPHRLGPRSTLLQPAMAASVQAALAGLLESGALGQLTTADDITAATERFLQTVIEAAKAAGATLWTKPRLPRRPQDPAEPPHRAQRRAMWLTPAVEAAYAARKALDKTVRTLTRTLCELGVDPADPVHPQATALREADAARQEARRRCTAEERTAKEAARRRCAAALVRAIVDDPMRLWRKADEAGMPGTCPCSPEDQRTHFERVVNPPPAARDPGAAARPQPPPRPTPARPALTQLDADLTVAEVEEVVRALKLGKASDARGLCSELLRGPGAAGDGRVGPVAAALTPLLQAFFTTGFPASLSTATLVPIYKGKGDPGSMDNYRGIALMSILGKVYAMVLMNRLTRTLEDQGLRSPLQFGFRPKRGTMDAAMTLQTVVDRYAGGEGTVYAAFVDFSKAFDMMPRDRLWERLETLGVRGPFLAAVKSYYASVLFQVNTAKGLSAAFPAASGVKQGCPLSPVLFGCFIEGLAESLPVTADAPKLHGQPVPTVLYADDTTLLSLSRRGLQALLDRLAAFCEQEGMKVNEGKTKVMVFRSGDKAPADAATLRYQGQPLEVVDEFKFLGVPLKADQRSATTFALETLANSAAKSYIAMWTRARAVGVEDFPNLEKLFDACVLSVAGYAAPVFAPYLPALTAAPDAAERLHLRFLRAALGVPWWTSKAMLYLETGRLPLRVLWLQRAANYLRQLAALPEDNILHCALRESLTLPKGWAQQLYRHATSISQPPGPPPAAAEDRAGDDLPLADFVTAVTDRASLMAAAVRQRLWAQHVDKRSSMNARRPYFPPTFDRHRLVLGGAAEAQDPPEQRAPYLDVVYSIADRSLLAGLRMHPSVRGLNVGGAAPEGGGPSPTDIPGLCDLCCPRCQRPGMSYTHALSCAGFAPEHARFQLDNGLNLVGCLRRVDGDHLGRLCGFVRLVRGLTGDPQRLGKKVWRTSLDAYPPQVWAPDEEADGPPRAKHRPARALPPGLAPLVLPAPAAPPPPDPPPAPAGGPPPPARRGRAGKAAPGAGAAKPPTALELRAARLHVPPAQLAEAEANPRPWTHAAVDALQEIVDDILVADVRAHPHADSYSYPSYSQVVGFLFARGFLHQQKQIEPKLQQLRGNARSQSGAEARIAHLRAAGRLDAAPAAAAAAEGGAGAGPGPAAAPEAAEDPPGAGPAPRTWSAAAVKALQAAADDILIEEALRGKAPSYPTAVACLPGLQAAGHRGFEVRQITAKLQNLRGRGLTVVEAAEARLQQLRDEGRLGPADTPAAPPPKKQARGRGAGRKGAGS